jgi:hypothetical protein
MCLAVAQILVHSASSVSHFAPLGVFFVEVWTLTWLQGASAGQRILRFSVVRFADGGRPNAMQCLIRTFLLCLVVTAVTFDENGRGLHERLSGTVLSA